MYGEAHGIEPCSGIWNMLNTLYLSGPKYFDVALAIGDLVVTCITRTN